MREVLRLKFVGGVPIREIARRIGVATVRKTLDQGAMWEPISTAPYDRDLELVVIDRDGPHALVFACRRNTSGWINSETKAPVEVRPTHWRPWDAKA